MKNLFLSVIILIVNFTLNSFPDTMSYSDEGLPLEYGSSITTDPYIGEDLFYLREMGFDLGTYVMIYCDEYRIPIKYIYRAMYMESKLGKYNVSFSPNKDGSVDRGVMHINSNYVDYFVEKYYDYNSFKEPFDIHNEEHNIQVSLKYIRDLKDRTGSWYGAFVSYNGGVGNYFRNTASNAAEEYGMVVISEERLRTKYNNIRGMRYWEGE